MSNKNVTVFPYFILTIREVSHTLFVEAVGTASSINIGGQKHKEDTDIYTKNTMGRYIQAIICGDDFLDRLESWLESLDDERMRLLRSFIYEVELSDIEELKDTLYAYGGHLTEKNYLGRKFFEQMTLLLRQMELNRRTARRF